MSIAIQVAQHLPFLRRFARALVGSQAEGDDQVVRLLEALLADSSLLPSDLPTKLALYRVFVGMRRDAVNRLKTRGESGKLSLAEARLSHLTRLSREAFLLTTVEEFSIEDAARILECSEAKVRELVDEAGREITRQVATEVLIIEDEPMIAIDIETIVQSLGHRVHGVARTHDESVALFKSGSPGLVLADIQLGARGRERAFAAARSARDLHHLLSGAPLDGREARADLPPDETLSAGHRARDDQPSALLR